MHLAVYLPLLGSALLALFAASAGRRLPPAAGSRLLLLAATVCVLSTLLSLAALAATMLGQLPPVAAVGGWSATLLHRDSPIPPTIGQLASIALGVVAVLFVVALVRGVLAALPLRRLVRAHPHRLIVVDDVRPDACALGGRGGGRIVVTTSMLRALTGAERRVLLAHEAAHLRHRHHLYRAAANVLAALDPLLITLPGAVRHLTERWADQDAAVTVGDRRLVAAAVGRATLARHAAIPTLPAKARFGRADTVGRLRALLFPRRWLGGVALVALMAMLASTAASAVDTGEDAGSLFETAGRPAALHHSTDTSRTVRQNIARPATPNRELTRTHVHGQQGGDHEDHDSGDDDDDD